jgi:hypothetical protein
VKFLVEFVCEEGEKIDIDDCADLIAEGLNHIPNLDRKVRAVTVDDA